MDSTDFLLTNVTDYTKEDLKEWYKNWNSSENQCLSSLVITEDQYKILFDIVHSYKYLCDDSQTMSCIERKYCIWVDYVCLNWYLFKRVIFLYLLFSLIPYEFLDLYISYLSALDYNKIHSNGILLNNNYETLITLLSMTVFNICETCNPFR